MKIILLSVLICLNVCGLSAQEINQTEIRDVLKKQETAWNRGNINDFMDGYWRSDSLLFVGSSGPSYGWHTTLEGYKRRYPNKEAMGILHFDIREIRILCEDRGFVLGKWNLTRKIGDIGGYFTLLLKKINGKWVIVADHTS